MPDYSLFGDCLRSELAFEDLRPLANATPRWTLRMVTEKPPDNGDVIGEVVDAICAIRLSKHDDGFRLSHSCTADYDISDDGSSIACRPINSVDLESLRYDIANRVMAVAFHAAGALCLHSSAVQIDGGVIAFLAPKGYGKSTLASALIGSGAKLVTDDMLAVELLPEVRALPGILGLRLRDDSAQTVLPPDIERRRGVDGKHVVQRLSEDRLMLAKSPLAAIYTLAPVARAYGHPVVRRTRLSPKASAMSLVPHSKIGVLLGRGEAAVVLDRAVTLAREVPVFRLEVARDLGEIGTVVNQIIDWHTGMVNEVELAS